MAKISVFGMGYVGCVSAACLARDGHEVIGVDVAPVKLEAIRRGQAPVLEPGLNELIRDAVRGRWLEVTENAEAAVLASDLSLVCVGTPSHRNGSLDRSYLLRVVQQIGAAVAGKKPGHVIAIRSTMLPGTMEESLYPALERSSGGKDGAAFHLACNPEFLREGSAIPDYDNPPKIVIGTRSPPAAEVIARLYRHLDAPLFVVRPEVAELVKCVDNTWHALKIAFANEIGEVCRSVGADSHELMDIFLADTHLNISRAYLRPGFAFGGSCLPKDVRALSYVARHQDLEVPLLQSILPSNNLVIERVFHRILRTGLRRIGIYGLSFKADTDDLRESPMVRLVELLLGKGIEVRILDDFIKPELLTGANRQYINAHIPHLLDLLVRSFAELESFAHLIVIGHCTPASEWWARTRDPRLPVLDLVRMEELLGQAGVMGVSWSHQADQPYETAAAMVP